MKDNRIKKDTISAIDIMIAQADKGPSGFWTDDYEGCGNPDIFPEFDEGLKHGRYVHKEHFLCPWNTAVMYGDGHGNISTGCYHSCSIQDAKYLSAEMIATILKRFKKGVNSGQYDQLEHIAPLLTVAELGYIKKQKKKEAAEREKFEKSEAAKRRQKAAKLLQKYAGRDDVCELLCAYYGTEQTVDSGIGALIFFSPNSMKDVAGAEKLTYDDYIDAQIQAAGKFRIDFLNCYMNIPLEFKGEIEKIDSIHKRICFKRIFVTGMYSDGICFDGKEDHVWMSSDGFGACAVGDCFEFGAEVYRYLKTGNGKMIDYSLRNPDGVKRIDKYQLPTDKELALQQIEMIICESCFLSDKCSHLSCMRNPKEIKALKRELLNSLGSFDSKGERK